MPHSNPRAFTLIELLIVIGILSVLLSTTLVALNPQKQFYKVQEAQIQNNLRVLRNALYQCYLDNFQKGTIVGTCFNGTPTNQYVDIQSNGGINICPLLSNGYISKVPINTLISGTTPSQELTQINCNTTNYISGYQAFAPTNNSPEEISVRSFIQALDGTTQSLRYSSVGMQSSNYLIANTPTPTPNYTVYTFASGQGYSHTCGINSAGLAMCWGLNSSGQLGDSTFVDKSRPTVISGYNFSSISLGNYHTCAIGTNQYGYCWGRNNYGQLGNSTTTNTSTPSQTTGNYKFSQISGGSYHTCGIRDNGSLYCWGRNSFGELGTGDTSTRTSPQLIDGLNTYIAVSAEGDYHSCGIRSGGSAFCWGYNSSGQLGNSTTTNSTTPVPVSQGALSFTQLSLAGYTSCGLTTTKEIWCWGSNGAYELGNGGGSNQNVPVKINSTYQFNQVSAGGSHVCGLRDNGEVYCWGFNASGQLGKGNLSSSSTPTLVSGGDLFAKIASNANHTCGIRLDGKMLCWGENEYKQVGNESTTDALIPVVVVEP